jgi:hypothetical protein
MFPPAGNHHGRRTELVAKHTARAPATTRRDAPVQRSLAIVSSATSAPTARDQPARQISCSSRRFELAVSATHPA